MPLPPQFLKHKGKVAKKKGGGKRAAQASAIEKKIESQPDLKVGKETNTFLPPMPAVAPTGPATPVRGKQAPFFGRK